MPALPTVTRLALPSSITANSARAPTFEAVEQTTVFDDFTFQRDFDFGA
nr:hypothetical protein [uncultured Glaciecola sp.]